ncbi:PCC domain-containing protein [Saccharothrix syringae]|uniref:DUF296 domain-containing protein n=1 Tax=Saccharothrix syringae TaxID=103733 RepID=A0A5Q0HC01_SACSY|nr:DUF296 domain-containing protein [Saccharothrix syringae]QFZ23443.1 DUF296 domain-containing protein [Saccharothrix syringae]
MFVLEVNDGELIAAIEEQAAEHGIENAAIVSLIGGVDSFVVSTMPSDAPSKDLISSYAMPGEMHGAGEIRNGKAHVHVTMGVQGDRGVAGHLHSAEVGHWFARAYVIPC